MEVEEDGWFTFVGFEEVRDENSPSIFGLICKFSPTGMEKSVGRKQGLAVEGAFSKSACFIL